MTLKARREIVFSGSQFTFGTELSSSNPISSADLHNFYFAFHFASRFPTRLVVSRPQKQHLGSVIKMFTLSQLQSILLECKFALDAPPNGETRRVSTGNYRFRFESITEKKTLRRGTESWVTSGFSFE